MTKQDTITILEIMNVDMREQSPQVDEDKTSKAARRSKAAPMLSIGALADKCGVNRQRIYLLVREGRIHTVKVAGGIHAVPPDEVKRVLASMSEMESFKGRRIVRFSSEL